MSSTSYGELARSSYAEINDRNATLADVSQPQAKREGVRDAGNR